jgi:hypothetical protein
MQRKAFLLPLGLLGLAACTPVDTSYGEALRWDVAQQTVNPEPPPPQEGAPIAGGEGVRAASAVDRYQKGTVKQPTGVSGGGGSGGSGASSSGSN